MILAHFEIGLSGRSLGVLREQNYANNNVRECFSREAQSRHNRMLLHHLHRLLLTNAKYQQTNKHTKDVPRLS